MRSVVGLLLLVGCSAPKVESLADASVEWRSALFPPDWSPGFTDDAGRFLHDFSYAGFEGGATPPRAAPTITLEAPVGDATALIQRALDDGGVVLLRPGTWRIEGTLTISRPNVVLRGSGSDTVLVFTKSTGLEFGQNVTLGATPRFAAEAPVLMDVPSRATRLELGVLDGGLQVGDDVVLGHVITPEFIAAHGMTGTWRAFNDTWQPIAWRTITAIEGATVTIDVPLRSPLLTRDRPSLRKVADAVHHVGIESFSFTNAVDPSAALAMNQVSVFHFTGVKDAWVRDVHSISLDGGAHVQSGGVRVHQSMRVTVMNSSIGRAQNRGSGGNGYLFEVRQSNEVLFRDCDARDGRHNFIQNWGFGVSGCVWQRVSSSGGTAENGFGINARGTSEFHHSLATANLIEDSTFDDGFAIVNRGQESTGAGHTGTENVFWNVRGSGVIRSMQYGHGFVIGTDGLAVETRDLFLLGHAGTEPFDWVEGVDAGSTLTPRSLFDDQRSRRGR
ncbi:MAG: hypothetical protein GQE15_06655 [Archangiaceae bacterium]|nr:hypothetical protein [Archangiaceae bacterium]